MTRITLGSWSKATLLGLAMLLATCGDDEWRDKNRPATFFDLCEPTAQTCKSPFSCLPVPGLTGQGYCTLACTSDSDCPRWTATGHCAGPFQSRCLQGVCHYGCE
jgi:hypothetical protein